MQDMVSARNERDREIFATEMLNAFGGMKEFVREFAESIKAAEAGSSVQLQALNNVTKLLFQCETTAPRDELITEEVVRAQLHQILNQDDHDGS